MSFILSRIFIFITWRSLMNGTWSCKVHLWQKQTLTRIKGNRSKSLAGLVVGIQTSLDLDFFSSDSWWSVLYIWGRLSYWSLRVFQIILHVLYNLNLNHGECSVEKSSRISSWYCLIFLQTMQFIPIHAEKRTWG